MGANHSDAGWRDDAFTREIRARILFRDKTCQIGGPRCTIVATETDHIVPIALGGAAHDERNLRGACRTCNSSTGGAVRRPQTVKASEWDRLTPQERFDRGLASRVW